MDTVNVQYFYGLGLAVGKVGALAMSDERLNQPSWANVLPSAIEWSRNCAAEGLNTLPKTNKAAAVLAEAFSTLAKLLGQDRDVSFKESHDIQEAIAAFYHVFEQEVEDMHCYVVTPVGAFAVSVLLKNASAHLSKGAQQIVSKEVKQDFNKAGECLALDLYTACGFHAMRAVEAEASIYQREVTGVDLDDVPLGTLIYGDKKNYPDSGLRTQYAKEGSLQDSPLGLVVSLLSQLNLIYRIPIMHPKMQLDASKAKFVFDTAAIAISAMVEDALTRFIEKEKAATALAQAQALTLSPQP